MTESKRADLHLKNASLLFEVRLLWFACCWQLFLIGPQDATIRD
jgi:hypothetical protein